MDKYSITELKYDYDALEPHMSEEQLKIHHTKHHAGYVEKANKLLNELHAARSDDEDSSSLIPDLTFNISGHILHDLFWGTLTPNGGGEPKGEIEEEIKKEFGSFKRFRKEFAVAAGTIKGSGWAALAYCRALERPIILQIEKHSDVLIPTFQILMVLDMWEHAFYMDYKNVKADFIESFWKIVDWDEINERLKQAKEKHLQLP